VKKALSYFVSLIYYPIFGLSLVFFHGIQYICLNFFGFEAHKKSVDILNRVLVFLLGIHGTRYKLNNLPVLDRKRPTIFVCNHQSTYDIPPLIWYLRSCHPKFISKKELGRGIPSISYNLRNGGAVLIDRKDKPGALKAIKEFASNVSANNWSVVIFAEGTRSRDGAPKPFQKGGLTTLFTEIPNAQILPVSIANSWQLSRYNYFPIPLGVKVKIQFHPLLEIHKDNFDELIDTLEKNIHQGVNNMQASN